jgi:hypothetical protein
MNDLICEQVQKMGRNIKEDHCVCCNLFSLDDFKLKKSKMSYPSYVYGAV